MQYGLVWLVASICIGKVILTGQANLYFSDQMAYLVGIAGILSLGISYYFLKLSHPFQVSKHIFTSKSSLPYGVFCIGIIVLAFIPSTVLGAGSLSATGSQVTLIPSSKILNQNNPSAASPAVDTDLLHLQHSALTGSAEYDGKSVTITGFTYREPGLSPSEFLLVRYITPHCVAEAQPLGIVVDDKISQSTTKDNTWIQVTGNLQSDQVMGQKVLELNAISITSIKVPASPYLIY